MYSREQILDAFEKWNNGYRSNREQYMTAEECDAMADRPLAELQTDHLVGIMEDK